MKDTTETFVAKAKKRHGDTYDYSLVDYENSRSKVILVCKKHGDFLQSPNDHLQGKGCNGCAIDDKATRYYSNRPTLLYYLYFPKHNVWKIGITVKNTDKRYISDTTVPIVVLGEQEYADGTTAYHAEQFLLSLNHSLKYKGPPILNGGNTELFREDITETAKLFITKLKTPTPKGVQTP